MWWSNAPQTQSMVKSLLLRPESVHAFNTQCTLTSLLRHIWERPHTVGWYLRGGRNTPKGQRSIVLGVRPYTSARDGHWNQGKTTEKSGNAWQPVNISVPKCSALIPWVSKKQPAGQWIHSTHALLPFCCIYSISRCHNGSSKRQQRAKWQQRKCNRKALRTENQRNSKQACVCLCKKKKKHDGPREFGLHFPLCFLPNLHIFMHFLCLEAVLPPSVFWNVTIFPVSLMPTLCRVPWAPFQQRCAERWGAELQFSKETKEIFMENLVRIWHLALFSSFESPTLQEQSKQMYAPMLINPFGKISKKSLRGLETFEEREISCQPGAEIYLVPPCGPNHQSSPWLPFLLGACRAVLCLAE